MKEKIRLTKSEREIMNVLWDTREALTSSEIIKYSVNKTWKDTSVHLLLKTLLDKNIIIYNIREKRCLMLLIL